MDNDLLQKIEKLEKRYFRLQIAFMATIFLISIAFISLSFQSKEKDILNVKGIIVSDGQDKPRIVIGAPANDIKGRNREDDLIGIVYIDENGNDRLTFGSLPDPLTQEGILPRRVQGAGILIHDKEGIERGGYSVLDDSTALLTLDWPKTGEAIALSSNNSFSAIGLFYKSEIGQYREAITIGTIPEKSYSFIRFSDTLYNERLLIDMKALGNVEIKNYNEEGEEIE